MSWEQDLRLLLESRVGLDRDHGSVDGALRWVTERSRTTERTPVDLVAELAERGGDDPVWHQLVGAATVGHSYFFRDREQLNSVMAHLRTAAGSGKPVRVWSAACSGGQEAWTLTMLAARARLDLQLVATDVDAKALEQAAAGVYPLAALRSIPDEYRQYLDIGPDSFEVAESLRPRVQFRRLNLVRALPPAGAFDAVLCRNALLYLSAEARELVANRVAGALGRSGTLWIGATESLRGVSPSLGFVSKAGRMCYVRRPTKAKHVPLPRPRPPKVARNSPTERAPATPVVEPADDRAISDAALDPRGAFRQGVGLRREGRLGEACGSFRRALFLAPDMWPAAYLLAGTAARLGLIGTWQRELRRTIRLLEGSRTNPARYDELMSDLDPIDVLRSCVRGLDGGPRRV